MAITVPSLLASVAGIVPASVRGRTTLLLELGEIKTDGLLERGEIEIELGELVVGFCIVVRVLDVGKVIIGSKSGQRWTDDEKQLQPLDTDRHFG